LFPTHGENYGHVILEALLAGTPVLLSDQTPWRNLEEAGAGWDIPLGDTDSYRRVIEQCAEMDTASYEQWRTRVREYGLTKLEDAESVQANRELLLKAASMAQQRPARGSC
jgi:glycosyltransferase involved in cell wall biosynthesis